MQPQIGAVLEGKVTKVAAFGAFVALDGGGSGMVHISELSEGFVKDINTAVHIGDTLRVKIISVDERGRVGLSVRQALTDEERAAAREAAEAEKRARRQARTPAVPISPSEIPGEYTPYVRNPKPSTGDAFEDMMSRFKTASDEKISDLRRFNESKRGSSPGRRGGRRDN